MTSGGYNQINDYPRRSDGRMDWELAKGQVQIIDCCNLKPIWRPQPEHIYIYSDISGVIKIMLDIYVIVQVIHLLQYFIDLPIPDYSHGWSIVLLYNVWDRDVGWSDDEFMESDVAIDDDDEDELGEKMEGMEVGQW